MISEIEHKSICETKTYSIDDATARISLEKISVIKRLEKIVKRFLPILKMEYKKDIYGEIVEVVYDDEFCTTKRIDVTADSYIAMMIDVLQKLK